MTTQAPKSTLLIYNPEAPDVSLLRFFNEKADGIFSSVTQHIEPCSETLLIASNREKIPGNYYRSKEMVEVRSDDGRQTIFIRKGDILIYNIEAQVQ